MSNTKHILRFSLSVLFAVCLFTSTAGYSQEQGGQQTSTPEENLLTTCRKLFVGTDPEYGPQGFGTDNDPPPNMGCLCCHSEAYLIDNPNLICEWGENLTFVEEVGYTDLTMTQEPPPEIAMNDEGAMEITSLLSPVQGATRDRHSVELSSGQLEFVIPTGINLTGRAGHDLELNLTFRSEVYRPDGAIGPYWSLNVEDFLILEKIIDLGENSEGSDPLDPREMQMDYLVQDAPYINRIQNGRLVTYTNTNALWKTFCFKNSLESLDFHVPLSSFTADKGTKWDYSLESPNSSFYRTDDAVMSGVLDPFVHNELAESNLPDHFSIFTPQPGRYEQFRWNCNRFEIRENNGTIFVYSALFKRQDNRIFRNPSDLPHGRDGGLSHTSHELTRVQFKARLERIEYPDGNQVTYFYDGWGRLSSVRDVLGRRIHFIYLDNEGNETNQIRQILCKEGDGSDDLRIINLFYTDYYEKPFLSCVEMTSITGGYVPGHDTTSKSWNLSYVIEDDPDIHPNCSYRPALDKILHISSIQVAAPQDDPIAPYFEAQFTDDNPPHRRISQVKLYGTTPEGYVTDAITTYDYTVGQSWQSYFVSESVLVTDPDGYHKQYNFDALGNERLRAIFTDRQKTDAWITEMEYFPEGKNWTRYPFHLLYKIKYPEGNYREYYYKYDEYIGPYGPPLCDVDMCQFGNLLLETCYDKNGEVISEQSNTYEPLFNKIWTSVSPRGYEGQNLAENFTTYYTYDYMECAKTDSDLEELVSHWNIDLGVLETESNWGEYTTDYNDDGSMGPKHGKLIKVAFPTVTVGIAAENGNQESYVTYHYNSVGQIEWEKDEEGYITEYEYYDREDPNGDGSEVPIDDQVVDGGGYLKKVSIEVDVDGVIETLNTTYTYDFLGNLLTEQDPKGYFDVYRVNEWNEIYEILRLDQDTNGQPNLNSKYTHEIFHFDLNGNVVQMDIYNDNPDSGGSMGWVSGYFTYDILDQLREEEWHHYDPDAQNTRECHSYRHYDKRGNLTWSILPNNTAVSAEYNSRGRVSKKTRHSNLSSGGGAIANSDPLKDSVLEFDYDDNGNLVSAVDGVMDAYVIGYDGLDRRITLEEPNGTTTIHTRDHAGNITNVTVEGTYKLGSADERILKEAEYKYDEKNRLHKIKTLFFTIDEGGNQQNCVDGVHLGFTVSKLGLNKRGEVEFIEDDRGNRTEIEYDELGRETKRTLPAVEGFGTDERNRTEIEYITADNSEIISSYDFYKVASGDIRSDVLVTQKAYDGLYRLLKEENDPDGLSQETYYQYDSMGNTVRIINPNEIGTKNLFDTAGNLVRTEYGWDKDFLEELLEETTYNPDQLITTRKTYDFAGNLESEIDDKGNVTAYDYDGLNRRIEVSYDDGTYETIVYRFDDLIEVFRAFDSSDSELFSITNSYYPGKQKDSEYVDLPTGSSLSGNYYKKFYPDGLGRILKLESYSNNPYDSNNKFICATERNYDSLDNVVEEIQAIDETTNGSDFSTIHSATVDMSYDGLKNRTEVASNISGYLAQYEYDVLNRIEHIGFMATYQDIEYVGPSGRIWKRTNGNNTESRYFDENNNFSPLYDGLRRLKGIEHRRDYQGNVDVHCQFEYAHDFNNNRLFEKKHHYTDKDSLFKYDPVGRLKRFEKGEIVSGGIPSPNYYEDYGLDGVGNRIEHNINGDSHNNTVDDMNRYGASYNSEISLGYDERGNTTAYGDLSFVYDVYFRIVGAQKTGLTVNYVYDGYDRRLLKRYNSIETYYVMEGVRILQDVDSVTGNAEREYVWGSDIDELVVEAIGTDLYHVHNDSMGSPVLLTDSDGDDVERYDYNPFGKCDVTGGSLGSPYRFTGRRLDVETGLYYFRARHYSDEMGRFLSRDPIGVWGDTKNIGNSYTYAGNNPVNYFDPSGKEVKVKVTEEKDKETGENITHIKIKLTAKIRIGGEDDEHQKLTKEFNKYLRKLRDEIKEGLERDYSGREGDVKWTMTATVGIERSGKEKDDERHIIEITDLSGDTLGIGQNGGMKCFIDADVMRKSVGLETVGLKEGSLASLGKIVGHEIGHNLGLKHPQNFCNLRKNVNGIETKDGDGTSNFLKLGLEYMMDNGPGTRVDQAEIWKIRDNYEAEKLNIPSWKPNSRGRK